MNQKMPTLLVTGGAGYIGSHLIESLMASSLGQSHSIVVLDNLSTGHRELLQNFPLLHFEKVDLKDKEAVLSVFQKYQPLAVLHLAGLISVGESVKDPDLYYQNNVVGSQNLLTAMKQFHCLNLVFSSTASVYSTQKISRPLLENDALAPLNPYGETKLQIENQIQQAQVEWGLNAVVFRYFNACGASASGNLGEWHEPETHLIPLLLTSTPQKPLKVYGRNYETLDGTCIRDYVHVSDLANAHVMGLQQLLQKKIKFEIFNLGTGIGTSVLEVLRAAEKALGHAVSHEFHEQRPGDAPVLVANAEKAKRILGWVPLHSLDFILSSALKWHQKLGK